MDFDCHKPGKSVTRLFRLYNLILNRRLRREVPHECYVRNNQTIVESETRWTHDVIELFRHSNRYKLALTLTCNGRWLFEGCAPSDSLTMLFQSYKLSTSSSSDIERGPSKGSRFFILLRPILLGYFAMAKMEYAKALAYEEREQQNFSDVIF